MVTVYSKLNCQPCKMTKRYLDKANIPYTEVSLEELSEDELSEILALGHSSAPVVITATGESFSGYRPDMLKKLSI